MNRYSRPLIDAGTEIPWTFKTWLANFKKVDLPIGDLATDITKDKNFPDNDSFSEILEHLQSQTSDPDVIETFMLVWNFYLASK